MRFLSLILATLVLAACGIEEKLQQGECRSDTAQGSVLGLNLTGNESSGRSSSGSDNDSFQDQECSSTEGSIEENKNRSRTPVSSGSQKKSSDAREKDSSDFQQEGKSLDAEREDPQPEQYTYTDEFGREIRKTYDSETDTWYKEYWDEDQQAWIELEYY